MKKLALLCFLGLYLGAPAQEKYGNTLNLGLGGGYYGYYGAPAPAFSMNYEFDVAHQFTLAPFIGVASRRDGIYWSDATSPYKYYYYRETVIPVGVKAVYYFDELLHASDKWDFYLGASAGYAFRSVSWDSGYHGDRGNIRDTSPFYGNAHIGAEVHATEKLGFYLDLSTGLSTVGLALHF